MSLNPYESPRPPASPPPLPTGPHVPCPKCGAQGKLLSFSWWGGILGPWLLTHVACQRCGHQYNGKTGGSNNTAIAIYLGVGIVIGLILGIGFALSQF